MARGAIEPASALLIILTRNLHDFAFTAARLPTFTVIRERTGDTRIETWADLCEAVDETAEHSTLQTSYMSTHLIIRVVVVLLICFTANANSHLMCITLVIFSFIKLKIQALKYKLQV